MEVEVIPGELTEHPTADARGMERRAVGEFVGPRGELASYALGWTTGADHGRITVGIGRGNPGGGTFHAVVFRHGDAHAFQLVDDAFAEVPQGGPHLSAGEARGHEDVAFIWWVVDWVFSRDQRAWWLRHWLLGTSAIQTREVFALEEPVLLVAHDEDGLWQLIGTSDAGPDGKVGHLSHAIDEDPSLTEVLDLAAGERATRRFVGGPWTRHRS